MLEVLVLARADSDARFIAGFYGDRLMIEAPPHMQALLAPQVERVLGEWQAALQSGR
jgi:hypothetical protein